MGISLFFSLDLLWGKHAVTYDSPTQLQKQHTYTSNKRGHDFQTISLSM
jgi:hypothetical protein